jgi:Integrase zinc binding domain
MYHNHKTAGHPGELETYNGIRQNYWWPGLRTFVKNYVQGCGTCQQFKINRSPSNPAYVAIEGANNTRPFAKCSMDLITDLPPVERYDSILVVVDRGLSKGVILCPCAKTITWEGTATLLRDNLFKRFGLPDEIISDRDPRFAARAFQELLKLLNIKSNLTTAYHSQSDGATERVNQEIEAYLSIYCTSHPEDWLHSLSTLEFTHNNRRHAERVHSPFELIQGDNVMVRPQVYRGVIRRSFYFLHMSLLIRFIILFHTSFRLQTPSTCLFHPTMYMLPFYSEHTQVFETCFTYLLFYLYLFQNL